MQITETNLLEFLEDKIFLSRDDSDAYRTQVRNLRRKLEGYIDTNPEFQLVKMLNSGSVAKGTALSLINDMDVAVYVRPDKIPDHKVDIVLTYMREALIKVYKDTMSPDQFSIGTHCVRVSFRGSGLDVEVVPVIPNGEPDDRGEVLNNDTGEWVTTSIPLHLDFIKQRKDKYPLYADLVRMTKWWRIQRDFKLKSFLIELLWCYMVDTQVLGESRIDAFAKFLVYIIRTRLQEKIVFTDNYEQAEVGEKPSPVRIYDPVNPNNNVGGKITDEERDKIVEEAQLAFDALSMAMAAYTKGNAIANWQRILGSSFNP